MGKLVLWVVAASCCAATLIPTSVASAEAGEDLGSCAGLGHMVATDIDSTLTADDSGFIIQLLWPEFDPAQREAGPELFSEYAARGYWIVYVTARPEALRLGNGQTQRAATSAWLELHGFPVSNRTMLYLSPSILDALLPRPYKAGALIGLAQDGFTLEYAYGNAETDFDAFADAGIPKDRTFSIGERHGYGGTQPISGGSYATHVVDHLPTVAPVCDPSADPAPPPTCPLIPYDDLGAWLLEDWFGITADPTVMPCALAAP